ncbi:uncharacterized protein LOC134842091 [Symsagittifera roscoffensis]|uniref:uncharacterized protein LOC134842091 n=1 Tax=Symsagittifera roscoffensis TaxID=84072 RepID=UPI00307C6C01
MEEKCDQVYTLTSAGVERGMGLFATKDIQKGSVILRSGAVLQSESYDNTENSLQSQFQNLDEQTRNEILDLSNCKQRTPKLPPLLGIFQTNCSYIEDLDTYFLCVLFSRLNHSCAANCSHVFDRNGKQKIVRSIRNISENEELTICYLNSPSQWFLDLTARQAELNHFYSFHCDCIKCLSDIQLHLDLQTKQSAETKLASLFDKLNSKVHAFQTQEAILRSMIELLEGNQFNLVIQEFFHRSLFLLYCQTGNSKKAKQQAINCRNIWTILHGESSFQERRFEFFAKVPTSCFGEVETCYGPSELSEHDTYVLCGVINWANSESYLICRHCLTEVDKTVKEAIPCSYCGLVTYCSSICQVKHQLDHKLFCNLAQDFGNN